MEETPSELLESFLVDATEPRWSSFLIDALFSRLEGDAKSRLQQILPQIDDRLHAASHRLTATQTNFLRDITGRLFYGPYAPFTGRELSWLINRFQCHPSPQRGLMIALLLNPDELPPEVWTTISEMLSGTPGERFTID